MGNENTDLDLIVEIARKHIPAVADRGDLAARKNDAEDFIETSVWCLEAALREAYEAGRNSTAS